MSSVGHPGFSTTLTDVTPAGAPEVAPPTGLALTEEPKANVERYDGLRGQGVRHAS